MLKKNLEPDLNAARLHLRMLAGDDGASVSWQVFNDSNKERRDLARGFHGTLDEVSGRLKKAQTDGCGVFVAVNVTDGKARRKDSIIACRAVFLDLDGAPLP